MVWVLHCVYILREHAFAVTVALCEGALVAVSIGTLQLPLAIPTPMLPPAFVAITVAISAHSSPCLMSPSIAVGRGSGVVLTS